MYTPQTFVRVDWGYLAMLASQLLLSLIFFVATAVQTRTAGLHIFKGSPLATMCGLDTDARQQLGELRDFEDMERRAREAKVTLQWGGPGVSLTLKGQMVGGGPSGRPGSGANRATKNSL